MSAPSTPSKVFVADNGSVMYRASSWAPYPEAVERTGIPHLEELLGFVPLLVWAELRWLRICSGWTSGSTSR